MQVNAILDDAGVDVICLAGFMRIMTASFTDKWSGRLLNIHPALLPAFPGMNAQKQALTAGVQLTGCTVHFVDSGVDTGAIIAQDAVAVLSNDTEETLSTRIRAAEHALYPRALEQVARGAVALGADGKMSRK
jgi:formyltetrahydrofolate-dependent phosphoribosylglycinamide formyltransferase